jgi:hypothetical protein
VGAAVERDPAACARRDELKSAARRPTAAALVGVDAHDRLELARDRARRQLGGRARGAITLWPSSSSRPAMCSRWPASAKRDEKVCESCITRGSDPWSPGADRSAPGRTSARPTAHGVAGPGQPVRAKRKRPTTAMSLDRGESVPLPSTPPSGEGPATAHPTPQSGRRSMPPTAEPEPSSGRFVVSFVARRRLSPDAGRARPPRLLQIRKCR